MDKSGLVTVQEKTYVEAYNAIMRAFLSLANDDCRSAAEDNAVDQLARVLNLLPNENPREANDKVDIEISNTYIDEASYELEEAIKRMAA
jgi:hypothetical protein